MKYLSKAWSNGSRLLWKINFCCKKGMLTYSGMKTVGQFFKESQGHSTEGRELSVTGELGIGVLSHLCQCVRRNLTLNCYINLEAMWPVSIRHSIHEIATQPAILWIELGGEPKLPLKFWHHDVMRMACIWGKVASNLDRLGLDGS